MVPTLVFPAGDSASADVHAFVEEVCAAAMGKTPYSDRDLRAAVTRLASWARERAGLDLVRVVIFDRRTIDRFAAIALPDYSDQGRANMRSRLLRVAEVTLPPEKAVHRLEPIGPADAAEPYTHKETASLHSWARSQSPYERRMSAQTLIALGLGAGLSAKEIGSVRLRDVEVDQAGIVVHVVGERSRQVPLLQRWEHLLLDRMTLGDADEWAFRPARTGWWPNAISNFVRDIPRGDARPQTQRMRATWVVHHLSAGTPVSLLLKAAGVDSLEAFTRYVHFVPALEAHAARALLREAAASDL